MDMITYNDIYEAENNLAVFFDFPSRRGKVASFNCLRWIPQSFRRMINDNL